jgi:hypothetical protein
LARELVDGQGLAGPSIFALSSISKVVFLALFLPAINVTGVMLSSE